MMKQGKNDKPKQPGATDSSNLRDQFPVPEPQQWRDLVEKQLGGAAFDSCMVTDTCEGLTLQPVYTKEDCRDLHHLQSLPGQQPFLRGKITPGNTPNPWLIAQDIPCPGRKDFNKAAIEDLKCGQTAVVLSLDHASRLGLDPDQALVGDVGGGGVSLCSTSELAETFDNIDTASIPLFVNAGTSALPFLALLAAGDRSVADITGCVGADPLGELASNGTIPVSLRKAYGEMAETCRWAQTSAPGLRTILVSGTPYHNAGAGVVEQLAFAVATAVEYAAEMQTGGFDINDIARRLQFSFSLGSDFFLGIAGLRAARLLWSRVVESFGGSSESQKTSMHVRTSSWNKSELDPHVNLLRSATEAFSGVLGGCDMLQVGPFDEPVRLSDEFSRRIARNTQIILKQESHLDRVVDPAGGSWYVERLTDDIARAAWKLFQEVEAQGGMYLALENEFPQKRIEKTAKARTLRMATRRDILIGTNKYADPNEKPLQGNLVDIQTLYDSRAEELRQLKQSDAHAGVRQLLESISKSTPISDIVPVARAGATLGEIRSALRTSDADAPRIRPLRENRADDRFVRIRKAAATQLRATGTRPKAFVAVIGPPQKLKARIDFITEFFSVGGYEIQIGRGLLSAEDAAEAAARSRAKTIVICSTDQAYAGLVPRLAQLLKGLTPGTMILMAGNPGDDHDRFQEAGVDYFVHVGANAGDILGDCLRNQGSAL